MQSFQIWTQQIPAPTDQDQNITNQINSCIFSSDGQTLIIVVGNAILQFDAQTGEMKGSPLRGAHQNDNILCLAKSNDGQYHATGGADKTVILWDSNFKPIKKYSHVDAVQSLSFNPVTLFLFSSCNNETILCSLDQQNIDKKKQNQRITCSSWSPDGLTLAWGTINGQVSIRDNKLAVIKDFEKGKQIFTLQFSPLTDEHNQSLLVIGCWDQTLSFYNNQGQQEFQSKTLDYNPIFIKWLACSNFFVVTGTNKQAQLLSRQGNFIFTICTMSSWIWQICIQDDDKYAVATDDGQISIYKTNQLPIFCFNKEVYASRENLTDIIVQNLISDKKLKIRCKEAIHNISIYKDRLAVVINGQINVYFGSVDDLKYKLSKLIKFNDTCENLAVSIYFLFVSNEKKIRLLNFNGGLEREWTFEAQVNCMKLIGGPAKRESLIVGLSNGNVYKIFSENPFPILLIQQSVPVKNLDLSSDLKKLAIIDDIKNLTVYDVQSKQTLFSEMNVTSVAWNSEMDDLLVYAGNGMIFIKLNTFSPSVQKLEGEVIGFRGSKIFLSTPTSVQTIDVPQTANVQKFIELKDFQMAFKIACLGMTDSDFSHLGYESLSQGEFEIATKCFYRSGQLNFLDLASKYLKLKQQGKLILPILQAEILAYQDKLNEAGNLLVKAGMPDKAVEIFKTLKNYDDAKRFSKFQNKSDHNIQKLLKDQAEWVKETGDWKVAGELYIASKEYKKAIELYTQKNDMNSLNELCRGLDKIDGLEYIELCVIEFKKHQQHSFAKEAYLKLGNMQGLLQLYIENSNWKEAFIIANQSQEYMDMIKLPYAEYLCKMDRYEDALKVYKKINRLDMSHKMLQIMTDNASKESRFQDTAQLFWQSAIENLSYVKDYKNQSDEDKTFFKLFQQYQQMAEMYSAYQIIYDYMESPFQRGDTQLKIYNAAKFLIQSLEVCTMQHHINEVYVFFAMAKVSMGLESFKTARQCYEKLNQLHIPAHLEEEIELSSLLIRSKAFADNENIAHICSRCLHVNPVFQKDIICSNCKQPFVFSFQSFEVLSLVEFKIESTITHQQVQQVLKEDKKKSKYDNEFDGWSQSHGQSHQALQQKMNNVTPFEQKLNDICEMQISSQEYIPLVLDFKTLSSLSENDVYWVDLSQYCDTYEIKYYKNIHPEILLENCSECKKFFMMDEFESENFQLKKCPFCLQMDRRLGVQKDIFD